MPTKASSNGRSAFGRACLFFDDSKTALKPQRRSVEEVIRQLAPPAQIARVHGQTEQDVLKMAEMLGVDLTAPRVIKPANAGTTCLWRANEDTPDRSCKAC